MGKGLDLKKIIFTLIGFILFWAVITDAWGYSGYILKNDPYHIGTYLYGYISRLIWVIPAILLIIKYNDKLKFHKKELFSRPKFDKSLMLVTAVSFVIVVIEMLIDHKGLWFNSEVDLCFVSIKYIMVGVVEETVFRGWGYNSAVNILSHKRAAVITTVLFVILHWPSYFIKFLRFGVFDFSGIITQSISAFIWGVVFCWLLKRGKTIWNPVAAHIIYDFMCVLLIGGV